MENWQFLIQKQDDCPKGTVQERDRSWLALESPNVEIIEGRYRVVARSDLANKDVEVRITHSSTLELPPKRRIQKRSRRTNSEGLIAVIPFTYLKPGIWELSCSGDVMSDFLGQPWQHSVQLQVLPKVVTEEVARGDKEESPVSINELPKEEAIIDQPISPVWMKGETAQQILQNLIEIALPSSELLLEDDKTVEDSLADIPESLVVLKLEEEIYIAHWGQTLTINGYVKPKEVAHLDWDETSNYEKVYGGEIRIELRSPGGSEIVRRVRQSLPEKLIPFSIRCSIEIPADCESKLILGEISLYGILTIGGNATLLAHESFTVTADVTELLANTNVKDQHTPSAPRATSEAKKPYRPLDLKLFNLAKTPKKARSLLLHPSPKKSLPPKINPQSLRKSVPTLSPQLPRFVQRQNQIMSSADVSAPPAKLESSDKSIPVTAANQVTSTSTTFPYLRRLKTSQNEIEVVKHNAPETFDLDVLVHSQQKRTERDEDTVQLVADDSQSQHISFAELVLPANFVTTGNPNVSPLIRKWMHTQGYSLPEPINLQNHDYDTYFVSRREQEYDEVDTQTQGQGNVEEYTPSTLPALSYGKLPLDRLAQEIVIDDTFSEVEADNFKNQPSTQDEEIVSDVSAHVPVVREITELLPVPQLHLTASELVSGKSVRVRVQLAQISSELAVKLWVKDCQTRGLIDGPRLLTNLLPNSSGGLEENTHILVPFGCLEIRIEAIAVNIVTQQESDKVTLQRSVVPPDLPTLQLDELLSI
ncbi:hypothetical protein BZZ01_29445 [Nostocales cyanobacterium HT-58-2]|nr:hypothetical protein BZZ01_29445 [Nostocales cyanobacterium HT-58-2]